MSYEIFKTLAGSRGDTALVTVIDVQGSVPRHPGSKMLVKSTGAILGTVGGGKGEAAAIELAVKCIGIKQSDALTVEMQGTEAEGDEMVCGGTCRLLVEYVADSAPYAMLLQRLEGGEKVLLVKKLEGAAGTAEGSPAAVTMAVHDEGGAFLQGADAHPDGDTAAQCLRTGKPAFSREAGVFYDPIFPEEKLLILGGGHVGRSVAVMATELDFKVTIADDRKALLAPARFPPEVKTICGSYADVAREFPLDSASYVVIVTRGKASDLECIRAILTRTYRYAGFIGSTRKAKILLDQLREDGFPEEKVAAVHSPIGLDIKAETPAEIAVSILAELVAVRRNAGTKGSLSGAGGRSGRLH
jgi:xanthine dehydrogenase accessory factor